MNKAKMDGLVAKFLKSDDAAKMDAIWRQQSAEFRRFWSGKVLAKGTGTISDDECDVVIRILDRTGKGNTKESEVVAKTMVPQGAWRRLFNAFHADQKLASLVDSCLKEADLERKAVLLDELYTANQGKKNRLTGESASAINALLAAYDPVNNLSAVSLNHRKAQMAFLNLPFDFRHAQVPYAVQILVFDGGVPAHPRIVRPFGDEMVHHLLPSPLGQLGISAVEVYSRQGQIEVWLAG